MVSSSTAAASPPSPSEDLRRRRPPRRRRRRAPSPSPSPDSSSEAPCSACSAGSAEVLGGGRVGAGAGAGALRGLRSLEQRHPDGGAPSAVSGSVVPRWRPVRARPSWPGCRACGPWGPPARRRRSAGSAGAVDARPRVVRGRRAGAAAPSSRAPCGCASWPARAPRRRRRARRVRSPRRCRRAPRRGLLGGCLAGALLGRRRGVLRRVSLRRGLGSGRRGRSPGKWIRWRDRRRACVLLCPEPELPGCRRRQPDCAGPTTQSFVWRRPSPRVRQRARFVAPTAVAGLDRRNLSHRFRSGRVAVW